MIIARSPLRITLGGGGTDLPSYYRDHEGFLIAAFASIFEMAKERKHQALEVRNRHYSTSSLHINLS